MITRFRAFQLDSKGSLFSFSKGNNYTLIEVRIPKGGIEILRNDIRLNGKETIDILHISSWDDDHCDFDSLIQIINNFRPNRIEMPSYEPDTENGQSCKRTILNYEDIHQRYIYNVIKYDRQYINSLPPAIYWDTTNIVFHSLYDVNNHNDMSQIKLFRSEGFNVLSLGDCESEEITDYLINSGHIVKNEVDILILPHHGSHNSMLNGEFLDFCKPSLAVCSSNYDNEHDHPRQNIRNLLSTRNIKLMTTKRGDIIIQQEYAHSRVVAHNLVSNNEAVEEPFPFTTKRNNRK